MITDSLGLVALAMGAGAGTNPTLARTGKSPCWKGRRGPEFGHASVSADHSLPVRMAGQALSKFNFSHPTIFQTI